MNAHRSRSIPANEEIIRLVVKGREVKLCPREGETRTNDQYTLAEVPHGVLIKEDDAECDVDDDHVVYIQSHPYYNPLNVEGDIFFYMRN